MWSQVDDILGSRELWRSAAATPVLVGAMALRGRPRVGLAIAASVVVVSHTFQLVSLPWAALLAGVALVVDRGSTVWGRPLLSGVAAFGVYVCVPDTERALVVLGAVATAGAIALIARWPWADASAVVTAALLWIVVVDGPVRDSALVGSATIVVLHQLGQRYLARQPSPLTQATLLVVGAAAIGVAGRDVGLGPGLARPILQASLVVAGAVAATITMERWGPPSRERP
jgi:hypothetical protein